MSVISDEEMISFYVAGIVGLCAVMLISTLVENKFLIGKCLHYCGVFGAIYSFVAMMATSNPLGLFALIVFFAVAVAGNKISDMQD